MKKLLSFLLIFAIVLPLCSSGTAYAQGDPIWEKVYYTDVFGDPTDEWYITNREPFVGTFKNSATDGSPLSARILVDFDGVSIVLNEYGSNRVKNALSKDATYSIAIKTASGEILSDVGILKSGNDRITVTNSSKGLGAAFSNQIVTALYSKGTISLYIENAEQSLNNYLFKVKCGNFGELLSEEFYQLAIHRRDENKFEDAVTLFTDLGDYKDSKEQINITNYTRAKVYRDLGRFREAIAIFQKLGGYADSQEQIVLTTEAWNAHNYAEAESLRDNGNYKKAISVFETLGDYKDSREQILLICQMGYSEAEDFLTKGDIAHAAMAFGEIIDYEDAKERSFELWKKLAQRDTIAVNDYLTIGLKTNGTILTTEKNNSELSTWEDIVAVAAGGDYTLGLQADGSVLCVKYAGYKEDINWNNIVAITAGGEHSMCTASGLKVDGSFHDWTDIVAIASGMDHTVGLKTDGTVCAEGWNQNGQCDVSSWKNIVAIAADGRHTVGLKADGTVVAVGWNVNDKWSNGGQCDVSDWKDIVAIAAGERHTVGLKSDGTVVAVGLGYYGQCDVSDWNNIVAIAAGGNYTVGLKADGTVLAVGENKYGQCDVGNWTDIKLPNT